MIEVKKTRMRERGTVSPKGFYATPVWLSIRILYHLLYYVLLEIMIFGSTAVPSSSILVCLQPLTDFVLNAMQQPRQTNSHFYLQHDSTLLLEAKWSQFAHKCWIVSSLSVPADGRRWWLTPRQPLLSLLNETLTLFKYSPSPSLRGGRPSLGWNVLGLRKER